MANQVDPGWRPSLPALWWHLIPFVGLMKVRAARRKETNGLVVLRSVFLGIVTSLFLFLWAMRFITPWDGGDERWVHGAAQPSVSTVKGT